MARTPTAVLSTVGHMAQMAMVKSAAGFEFSKSTRPRGSQASGETGRSTWMMGSKLRLKNGESPSRKPSGVPTARARA